MPFNKEKINQKKSSRVIHSPSLTYDLEEGSDPEGDRRPASQDPVSPVLASPRHEC